jgi:hypothetical protein
MSEPDRPKLEYATHEPPRDAWQKMIERLALGWPLPWLTVMGAVVWMVSSLTLAPRIPLGRAIVSTPVLLAAGALWSALAVTRGWLWISRRGAISVSKSSRLALWCFPVLLIVGVASLQTLLVPRLAAWWSTSGAQRLAQQPTTAPMLAPLADQRIGVFRARDVERIPGGVTFTIGTSGLFGVYGYCYTDAGNPRPPSDWQGAVNLYPLGGGWWIWEWQD